MNYVIAIDPGYGGAICIMKDDLIIQCRPCPVIKVKNKREYDLPEMVKLLKSKYYYGETPHVFLEAVHSMPKQGVVSSFNFGKGYGIWIGIASALGFPLTLVRPQEWKREMLKGMPAGKGSSIVRAKQLFPHINLKATKRSRKDSDGLAEASLIAEFGRRTLIGKTM